MTDITETKGYGTCWFCGKAKAEQTSYYKVRLWKESRLREVGFPRCCRCQKLHKVTSITINTLLWISGFPMFSCLILLVVFPKDDLPHFIWEVLGFSCIMFLCPLTLTMDGQLENKIFNIKAQVPQV
jgi:hypothetical protein